ncbi:MAG: DMT family transporter [Melioribacteraceae bacterium]|nr:DMT family transporter [Melioribacteraceae bacterium]MCF8266291.1 DMT family transporter [Melioribacteraceae bacterium]MCF8432505.1 DMT family transporter [Melioribacteraceae bacterium]
MLVKKFAPFFVILAAILWGIDGVALRPELYSLPVPLVVFIESTIATVLLSLIFRRKRSELKVLKTKDWLSFCAVALLGGAIGTMAITKALFYVNYVNLSIVVLIQKLQPVFALSMAALLLKEKLSKKFFIWASFAILGAYIMTFGFSIPDINTDEETIYATIYALIAAFSFAASTVFSKRALKNVSNEIGTYLRFLFSSIILFILVIILGELPALAEVTQRQWIVFLLIAFTTGGTAIYLYYYGLKHISASASSIYELFFPLTAIVLEYALRDNILSWIQWGGVIILIWSIYKVIELRRSKIM